MTSSTQPSSSSQYRARGVSPSPQTLSRGKDALSSTKVEAPPRLRRAARLLPPGPPPTTMTSKIRSNETSPRLSFCDHEHDWNSHLLVALDHNPAVVRVLRRFLRNCAAQYKPLEIHRLYAGFPGRDCEAPAIESKTASRTHKSFDCYEQLLRD